MSDHHSYEQVFDTLITSETDVKPGLMMREPALKCRGKVFCFYYREKDALCVKLGKGYDISQHGVAEWAFLSPFVHKPPMTAWYVVGIDHGDTWDDLARTALLRMRTNQSL